MIFYIVTLAGGLALAGTALLLTREKDVDLKLVRKHLGKDYLSYYTSKGRKFYNKTNEFYVYTKNNKQLGYFFKKGTRKNKIIKTGTLTSVLSEVKATKERW